MTSGNTKWLCLIFLLCAFCHGNARSLRGTRELALAMNIVDQVYVEATEPQKLYQAAVTGMLKSLDRDSGYVPQDQLASFQSVFEQELEGLGVSLDGPPTRAELTVVSTIFNSPAFRAGIRPGDVIASINGEKARTWRVDEASPKLRGREGTSVRIAIERDGQIIEKVLMRERIELESVIGDQRKKDGTWEFLMQADPRVAYIRIELFGEKTASEFQKAVLGCETQPRALIIDLRDNAGGLLVAATQICDMFLDEGPIVTTQGRNQRIDDRIQAAAGTILPLACPIVVLINGNSASSSEILAACLKDRERARIVGTRSFGKGSVQNVIPLEGGKAAMRLTTAYYFPPSGRRIHRRNQTPDKEWGVEPSPDCEVPMNERQLEATVARLRERSLPDQQTEVPNPSARSEQDSDPSVDVDPQLSFALRLLQQQLDP